MRMRRTVGQMNSHLAAPSERHAPREEIARCVARAPRADRPGIGSSGSRSMDLPLDAKAGDIGLELLVLACLVRDGIPAVGDLLLGHGRVVLTGQVLGEGRVE